jgi:hypothetical protein
MIVRGLHQLVGPLVTRPNMLMGNGGDLLIEHDGLLFRVRRLKCPCEGADTAQAAPLIHPSRSRSDRAYGCAAYPGLPFLASMHRTIDGP